MKKKLLLLVPVLALIAFGISVPTSAKIIRRNNMISNPVTDLSATTFTELKDALMTEGNVRVVVTDHITVSETLNVGNGTYQIVSNGDVYLTRSLGFLGDLIYVPENSSLTIGVEGTTHKITLDGNKSNVADVDGSLIENWGTLNLLDGVTLTNNNSITSGVAVLSEVNSNLTIDGATVSNNTLELAGQYSAVYVKNGAVLNVEDATFTGNETNASGASLFINAGVTANIEDSTFTNNTCTNGHGPAMAIKADATISNITVENNVGGQAGALWIYNNSNVVISDSTFTNNLSRNGGAIRIQDVTTVTLEDCTFTGNGAVEGKTISGGALYAQTGATLNMVDCQLSGNIVGNYGGAIYAKECEVNLTNTDFTQNESHFGSAIALDNVKFTATDCEIFENSLNNTESANVPGAVYIYDNSDAALTNVLIKNNTGSSQGGGISVVNSKLTLTECEIKDHKVSKTTDSSNPYGGAMYANGSTVVINDSVIDNNIATKYGGAIYANNSNISLNNSTVSNSIAESSGGAMFVNSGSTYVNGGQFVNNISISGNGGAIANKGDLYITNNALFESNISNMGGGAIYNYELTQTVDGVAVHAGCAYISVDGATFKSNGGTLTFDYNGASKTVKTKTGGAINIITGDNLVIKNATFEDNSSTSNGGALCFNINSSSEKCEHITTLNIDNCKFIGNSTTTNGGAIYAYATEGTISNSTFIGGSSKYGGLASVDSNSRIEFVNVTGSNNSLTAGETDLRGKDIYVLATGDKNTVVTLNGGSYENIGVQYGILRVGGNLTISEFIRTWASLQTTYVYVEVFDIIPNPIHIQPKYATESLTDGKFLLRIDSDAKANVYQLVNNFTTQAIDGKTENYYFRVEGNNLLRTECDYFITTPLVCATTCPLGANAGDEISFTTINGYSISNVKINGTEITATDGVYTFTMPDSAVELTYDYELLPLDIGVDEGAKDYISVASTAKLGEKVTVTPIVNNEYRVTNVYYTYNYVKYNLDYDSETNTYSFTMFEGVDLKIEKIVLFDVKFADNEHITTTILSDGRVVSTASQGEEIAITVEANHSRYMLDLANSYYMIEGDQTKYSISSLNFTMPSGDVTITIEVVDIYEEFENIVEVYTFNDLVEASKLDTADIIINQDIEITSTIQFKDYGTYNIVGSGVRTIKRANNFTGAMFVIQEFTEVTLGVANSSDPTNTLTFDGNKENVTSQGSMFVVRRSAVLNINNYVIIKNNKVDLNNYYETYKESTSLAGGSAIYIQAGVVYLNGGEIIDNESLNNGGAILNYGTIFINSGRISNNYSAKDGGAIYNYRYIYLNGGEVSYNEAMAYGGAIYNNNNHYCVIEIRGGELSHNVSVSSGGALFNSHRAFAFIYDGNIVNNASTKGNGGAIYTHGKMIVRGGYFANNSATYKDKNGGAIYLNTNTSQAQRFNAGELYLYSATFENNSAYNGGAIATYTNTQLFIYEDSVVTFKDNTALNRGGAIYLMSDKNIKHSVANIEGGEFTNNRGVYGKDIAIQYGVLNIGGKAVLDEVQFVASPQAKYGYLNVTSNMVDTFTIVPLSYSEQSSTYTFVRFEDDVDSNKLLDTISVKQKSGTTWTFVVSGNSLVLSQRQYAININEDVRAINVPFNANANEVVTVETRKGYKVTNLKYNGIDILNNSFRMPEGNVEITYDYEYVDYLIIVKENNNGLIETSRVVATINDEVTLTVTPNAGYFLKALYINGVKVDAKDNTYTFVTDKNVEITASFEKVKYAVGLNYNYDNKFEIQYIYYGSKIKEETPKRSGYTFAGWFTDVELTQEFDFNSTITGVTQLYAKWVKAN